MRFLLVSVVALMSTLVGCAENGLPHKWKISVRDETGVSKYENIVTAWNPELRLVGGTKELRYTGPDEYGSVLLKDGWTANWEKANPEEAP